MNRPIIAGHRGLCTEPENTLRAFRSAIALGIDMVEFDVRVTKDKVPVVVHDDDVYRTTNGKGKVHEMTLKDIKQLDAGGGEKVPTLQEVIDLVKGKAKFVIELKSYNCLKPVARLVKQNGIVDDSIVISFGHIMAKWFKKLVPKIKTGICIVALPIDPLKAAQDANADYIISYYETLVAGSILYKKIIKRANRQGIGVFAAEMDEKSRMTNDVIAQLYKLGVNGYILNNPAAALKNFEKKGWFPLGRMHILQDSQ
jgi:glycerophosphoryl diester phosphodiesterase